MLVLAENELESQVVLGVKVFVHWLLVVALRCTEEAQRYSEGFLVKLSGVLLHYIYVGFGKKLRFFEKKILYF